MALSEQEQIKNRIDKSERILIISKRDASGDSMGSMLALYLTLKKIGKEVSVVSHGTPNILYKFLPNFHQITSELTSTKDFIISLDISNAAVGEFSYKIEGNKLNIYIEPEKGEFDSQDVSAQPAQPKYDLIVSLNCPDFAYMGDHYENNPNFFYETPVINIDHRADNENYGNINLVDVTATSTAEILYELIEDWDENIIDEDIATCLLTGIITDTNSFQNQQTTPKSLQISAELINLGADQQSIVHNLYRTKSLNKLKLWGRLLARIKLDSKYKLAWTLVDLSDFQKTNSQPQDLSGISEELISSSPDAEIILILARVAPQRIKGFIHTTKNQNAAKLANMFNGSGNDRSAVFELEKSNLIEEEKNIIETLRACRNGKNSDDQ